MGSLLSKLTFGAVVIVCRLKMTILKPGKLLLNIMLHWNEVASATAINAKATVQSTKQHDPMDYGVNLYKA